MSLFDFIPKPGQGKTFENGLSIFCTEVRHTFDPLSMRVKGQIKLEFSIPEEAFMRYWRSAPDIMPATLKPSIKPVQAIDFGEEKPKLLNPPK